jgi:toxin HigB-1
VIKSFGEKRTERLFHEAVVREFQGVARRAKRRLEALHAAARLEDLRVPPSNRLEKLRGDLQGFHAIRINDQYIGDGGSKAFCGISLVSVNGMQQG